MVSAKRERETKLSAKTVVLTKIPAPARCAVDFAIKGRVRTQITPDLDAGVGARDVEESGAVKRADPHIFDCLGLDRKVGRLCPA